MPNDEMTDDERVTKRSLVLRAWFLAPGSEKRRTKYKALGPLSALGTMLFALRFA